MADSPADQNGDDGADASPGAEGQNNLASSQVQGGLLDPRNFPVGATGNGTPPATDGRGGPAMSQVQGGLLDPRNFPVDLPAPALNDLTSVRRQAPILTGPLDADPHAEALEDLGKSPANDDTIVINGQRYSVLKARTFDPARSNGATAMPGPDVVAAAIAGRSTVAVRNGSEERAGYIVPFPTALTADPVTGFVTTLTTRPMVFEATGVNTGATDSAHFAKYQIPANALAGIHGHIDSMSGDLGPGIATDAPRDGRRPSHK